MSQLLKMSNSNLGTRTRSCQPSVAYFNSPSIGNATTTVILPVRLLPCRGRATCVAQ